MQLRRLEGRPVWICYFVPLQIFLNWLQVSWSVTREQGILKVGRKILLKGANVMGELFKKGSLVCDSSFAVYAAPVGGAGLHRELPRLRA